MIHTFSLAFVYGGTTQNSDVAVKVTTWSFKGKNFQWGLHSIMLRRLF